MGELGTSETERQIAAAEIDIKRLDAERELEMIELQMGLRDAELPGGRALRGSHRGAAVAGAGRNTAEAQAEGPPEEEERSRG